MQNINRVRTDVDAYLIPRMPSQSEPRRKGVEPGLTRAILNAFNVVPVGVTLEVLQVQRLVAPYSMRAARIELFRMRMEGLLACRVVDNRLAYYLVEPK